MHLCGTDIWIIEYCSFLCVERKPEKPGNDGVESQETNSTASAEECSIAAQNSVVLSTRLCAIPTLIKQEKI